MPPDERVLPDFSTPWPWACDSFIVVYAVAKESATSLKKGLEESVATWSGGGSRGRARVANDGSIPAERPGIWSAETPEWIRTLGTVAGTHTTNTNPWVETSPHDWT